MSRHRLTILSAILPALLLAACGPSLRFDRIVAPPATPIPPTPIATSQPVEASMLSPGSLLLYVNEFEDSRDVPEEWLQRGTRIQGGVAQVTADDLYTGLQSDTFIENGQSVLLTFRYHEATSLANIVVQSGNTLEDADFRSFGLSLDTSEEETFTPFVAFRTSFRRLEWMEQSGVIAPERWYLLAIHVGGSGRDFEISVQGLDDPNDRFYVSYRAPVTWDSRQWLYETAVGWRGGEIDINRLEIINGQPNLP
ncbi:MAG: hypothetical protein IT326_07785 [Anaerolineae bacterium]|nr:hypothetical protein [Anaerolineae bacterium]